MTLPRVIHNHIDGADQAAMDGATFDNISPHDGRTLCLVARSSAADVDAAVQAAAAAQKGWAATNVVARSELLREVSLQMVARKEEIAEIVATESGKILSHAMAETQAAIEMGLFMAGEGRRYYGRTTTATMDHRTVMTKRQPLGIAALIIASNTPIANVAWKAFPSILCGNASILKPSEDTPGTAWIFAEICRGVGMPQGVLNVIHGFGDEAGAPLVADERVALVSFTGSCATGRIIQEVAGKRLAKVCMELGGKNALVVCDDADLDNAVHWTLQSGFSNAGQRCAAASRIVVFDAIYDAFREKLVAATEDLTMGLEQTDFAGPVINERSLQRMSDTVAAAVHAGATLTTGGSRLTDDAHVAGFYMAPTILENVDVAAPISDDELFGPVVALYRVGGFDEAVEFVNRSSYGLTSCIHTLSVHRAMEYADRVEAGVVVVNGGTHGSEPHMGFGGVKNSGTGWREAGVESLDVYSDWKYVSVIADPGKV